MKKQNLILVLALVAFGFASCNSSQTLEKECVDNIVYLTVFEDLPYGFDSVQVVSPQNSIFKSVTHPDGELTASLFYYSGGRIVAVLSNGETAISRIFADNRSISEELKVEKIIEETNLRSGSPISYVFSVSGEVIFTIAESDDLIWSQNPTTRSWIDCVDRLHEQMCAGDGGSYLRLVCRVSTAVAVTAAAAVCLIDSSSTLR